MKICETNKMLTGEKFYCVDGIVKAWLQNSFKVFMPFPSLLANY